MYAEGGSVQKRQDRRKGHVGEAGMGYVIKRLDVNVCAPVPPCSVFNETKGSETMKN